MKRKLIFTALLLCVTLYASLSVFGQDLRTDFSGEGGEQLVTRGDYVLRGTVLVQYQGNAEHVTIPANLGITEIADHVFQHSGIVSITVPEGVQKIGSSFNECYSLTTVRLPESLRIIGNYAFDASNRLANVNIPAGVTVIGDCAFWECSSLTSITIPSSVTTIGSYAFYSCTGLTSITISSGVTSIGNGVFINTAWFNNQPDGLVYVNKILYTYKGRMSANTVLNNIRADTIAIADSAFYYNNNLTDIIIPSSVTIIGNSAFSNCTGLTSIMIPASVTSIGNYAFSNCSRLTSINVDTQNRVYSSVDGVLFNKNRTVLVIYPAAKQDRNYNIPSGVTSVGDYAFRGCSGLTGITIPSSVTSVGNYAFYGCTGLTSVTIPSGVISIGYSAFYGCIGLTSVTIPSSVTAIGNSAFSNCTGLTSVTISSGITTIGYSIFSGCTGLTSITIPSSVASIENYAFSGCRNLRTVTVSRRTNIGNNAFPATAQITYSD